MNHAVGWVRSKTILLLFLTLSGFRVSVNHMPIADEALRVRLNVMINKIGTTQTSKELGVSPEALARLVAALDVRNGTIAQAEKLLPSLERTHK